MPRPPLPEKVRLQIELNDAAAPDGAPGEAPGTVSVADLTDPVGGLVEGLVVRIDGAEIQPLPEAKAGAFDYGRYLRRRGQHVVLAAPLDACRVVGRRGRLAGSIDRLRLAAERTCDVACGRRCARSSRPWCWATTTASTTRSSTTFAAAGSCTSWPCRARTSCCFARSPDSVCASLGISRGTRTALLVPVVCVYVIVTGASPSIVRAGVAGVAGLLATLVLATG